MNRWSMRLATALVTACVAVGAAGLASSNSASSKLSLGGATAVVSGAVLANVSLDLPGARSGLGDTLLLSEKESVVSSQGTSSEAAAEQTSAPSDEAAESVVGADAAVPAAATAPAIPPAESAKTGAASPEAARTDRKLVFIYHSHNRESWLPELRGTAKDRPNEAFDESVNVSLLGERLRQRLEEDGVGAVHSGTDYNTAVPNFNYNYSYKYSKTTVKEALAVHEDLVYLLDIHRDSSRRDSTTITIDGADYAKLYFIVGQGNPNWKDNEALAQRIHEKMEAALPGVSKGILTKGAKHGHGEYNQSLSKGSVLVEIGGVDNTLEESYRTIDALASIVAELAKDAVKANAEPAGGTTPAAAQ
ncbi:stage II sporulation protein P [Paenibacillus sp.]|uniref:stage II sporulation protein P n=1 Tax=Paenibacillus sp. TaxID=58172 RepID=UPI002D2F7971|nr:stage II sporulation protein P [Paenibacillus sp.]HZG57374.1 stage II sporulation protein P [Paenibacillus sp.]